MSAKREMETAYFYSKMDDYFGFPLYHNILYYIFYDPMAHVVSGIACVLANPAGTGLNDPAAWSPGPETANAGKTESLPHNPWRIYQ